MAVQVKGVPQKKRSRLQRKSWIWHNFRGNVAQRHDEVANHISWRSGNDWSHSGRNASCVFTLFDFVHQFKTHQWMPMITVVLACWTCCGSGMTIMQGRTGQLRGMLFSMDEYYRWSTRDISLYIFKIHSHFGLVLCYRLKQSDDLPHPGCLLFIFNPSTRTNNPE